MSWSDVIIDFSDEETINFGKRFETFAENSLYRIRTLATIASSSDVVKSPCFFGRANRKVCAIIADTFVHVFDSDSFKCLATVDFDKIVRNLFVFSELSLILVDVDGRLQFFSYEKQQLVHSQLLGNGSPSVAMDVYYNNGTFSIVSYSEQDGSLRLVCFSWLKNKVGLINSKVSIEHVLFGKVSRCIMLSENSFILLSGSPTVLSMWKYKSGELGLTNSVYSSYNGQSLRYGSIIGHDEFLLCVDRHSSLYLYNLESFVLIRKWKFNGDIECFVVLCSENVDSEKRLLNNIKLAVVCRLNEKFTFEIRNLHNFTLLYSFVGAGSMDIVFGLNDFDGICVLESAKMNSNSLFVDEIRIRLVEEIVPHEKFHRLISRGQFREAEQFAILYGMDFQMIYKAELKHLLAILNSIEFNNNEESYLKSFLECSNKISKDPEARNFVAELCLNFNGSNHAIHERMLRHVANSCFEFLNSALLNRISIILYRYSTFRLVYPDDENSYRNALLRFQRCKMFAFFVNLIEIGEYANSSIVLQRHENEFQIETIDEEFLKRIFSTIFDLNVLSNSLIEFLRDNFLPFVLHKQPNFVDIVRKFLYDYSRNLESTYPNDFPRNALEFAEMLKRISGKLTDVNSMLTPNDVERSAYLTSVLLAKPDSDSSAYRLNRLIFDLNRLNRFRSIYKFAYSLSLDEFVEQTDEKLCYIMLEKTVASELLEKLITKSLQPFCQEKRLDLNLVLFNYVKDYLQNCLLSPLDCEKRAITIYHFLTSVEYKCQCVLKLMEFARLPFSFELDNVIKESENFCHPLVSKIVKQKEFANVKRILNKYDMSLDYSKNPKFAVNRILSQYEFPDVLDDALAISAKFNCFPPAECYLIRLNHLMNCFQYESAGDLLETLPVSVKKSCIDRSIDRLRIILKTRYRLDESKVEDFEQHISACLNTLSPSVWKIDDVETKESYFALKSNFNASAKLRSKFGIAIDHFPIGHYKEKRIIMDKFVRSFLQSDFDGEKSETEFFSLVEIACLMDIQLQTFLIDLLQSLFIGSQRGNLHKAIMIFEFVFDETLHAAQLDSLVDLFLIFSEKLGEYCIDNNNGCSKNGFQRISLIGSKLLSICGEHRLVDMSTALITINNWMIVRTVISGTYNGGDFLKIFKSTEVHPLKVVLNMYRNNPYSREDIELILALLGILPSYFNRDGGVFDENSSTAETTNFPYSTSANLWTNLVENYFENYLLESQDRFGVGFAYLLTLPETKVEDLFNKLLASSLAETPRIQGILYKIVGQLSQYKGDPYRIQAIEFYKRSLFVEIFKKKFVKFSSETTDASLVFVDLFNEIHSSKKATFSRCRRIFAVFCSNPSNSIDEFESVLMRIVEDRLTSTAKIFLDEKRTHSLLIEIRRFTDEILSRKSYRRKFVENFRRILWHVQPYAYELLKFCLEFACTRLDTDSSQETELVKFHEKLLKFVKFLTQYNRRTSIDNAELTLSLCTPVVDEFSLNNIPRFYSGRLPFRCFYEKDKQFQIEFWSTVMKREIEFTNFELWAKVLKKFFVNGYVTSIDLLKLIIQKLLDDSCFDENSLEKVEQYLMQQTDDYKNSFAVLAWLADKISSSDMKVKAYEMCVSLLNQWKNHLAQSEQKTLSVIEDTENNFINICRKSRTKDLLVAKGLCKSSTEHLCDQPSRLIIHLLMSDDVDFEKNDFSQTIRKLADINNVDLDKLFSARLKWWFFEHFGKRKSSHGIIVETGTISAGTRLCNVLDLSFSTLNKILLLFDGKSTVDSVYYLMNIIQTGDTETSVVARVQAIRVLFLLLKPQLLDDLMLGGSKELFEDLKIRHSTNLRTLLRDLVYVVWMENLRISRVTNLASFQEFDKQMLSMSLCKNLNDQKNLSIYSLIVSLVSDFTITNENIINSLVQTACNLKSNSIDATCVLLLFIHKHTEFWSIKGLKKLWNDVSEVLQENSKKTDSINSLIIKRPEL